jgi:CheY-like chemotaxis protein
MALVLLIEDDAAVRDMIARLVERMGHQVVQAPEGRAGLRAFEREAADVVITDINMPEMDGIEVISCLRRLRAGVPIIAISGGGLMPKELLLSTASALGAIEVLPKPFVVQQLRDALDRALGAVAS